MKYVRGVCQRFLSDTNGSGISNMFSFAPTWFIVSGVFLMNVQLSRNYMQRDMVDHAAAIAADTAMKTICADARDFGGASQGEFTGGRASAIRASVEPVLGLVAQGQASALSKDDQTCKVTARPVHGGIPGSRQVEVEVRCEFPCDLPFAAQMMCSGSPRHVTFAAKQTTVAMGCDMRDGA
ncbi:hypothetical protein LZC95_06625 [Pendulispora brunnea]|uniref:Flp pilus-assembly TadG-like N-terminal domain-containing protein n=1 Tax=Pendulispora brunnea TaxID=2905690 RepID=A0ABZ2KCZ6_9BACT